MKRMAVWMLFVAFVMPLAASQIFAADGKAPSGIVDAGNKLCPVSDDPVSGTDFVEYQGKRYGLCCPMCKAMFLKNPEKHIAQMEAKQKGLIASATVIPILSESEQSRSEQMEKNMEQGSL